MSNGLRGTSAFDAGTGAKKWETQVKGESKNSNALFGGGVSSSLAGSSVAEKNLDRYTVLVGIVWFACIVGIGLWLKVAQAG